MGDVIVVTQKVVSKAEGRLVRLTEVEPGAEAGGQLVELSMNPVKFLKSPLLSRKAKWRMAGEFFVPRRKGLGRAADDIDADGLDPLLDLAALLPDEPVEEGDDPDPGEERPQ